METYYVSVLCFAIILNVLETCFGNQVPHRAFIHVRRHKFQGHLQSSLYSSDTSSKGSVHLATDPVAELRHLSLGHELTQIKRRDAPLCEAYHALQPCPQLQTQLVNRKLDH